MLSTNSGVRVIPIKPMILKTKEQSNNDCSLNTDRPTGVNNAELMLMLENFNLEKEQFLKEKELFYKSAQEERKKMLNEVTSEIENLKSTVYKESYDKGYLDGVNDGIEKGHLQGFESAKQESSDYVARSKEAWIQANEEVSNYLTSINPMLLDLLKRSVEKITRFELSNSEEKLFPVLEEICHELTSRKQIFIRVHPALVEAVQENLNSYQGICLEAVFKIYPDLTLSESDCLVETESESFDLRVETQSTSLFEEIKRRVGL